MAHDLMLDACRNTLAGSEGRQGLRRDWPAEWRVGSIFNGAREDSAGPRRGKRPDAAALASELISPARAHVVSSIG